MMFAGTEPLGAEGAQRRLVPISPLPLVDFEPPKAPATQERKARLGKQVSSHVICNSFPKFHFFLWGEYQLVNFQKTRIPDFLLHGTLPYNLGWLCTQRKRIIVSSHNAIPDTQSVLVILRMS